MNSLKTILAGVDFGGTETLDELCGDAGLGESCDASKASCPVLLLPAES